MLVVVVKGGLGASLTGSSLGGQLVRALGPAPRKTAPRRAASTKDFASRVASGTERPSPSPAQMAAESEQPVP
jgi:hypothetical protein